MKTTFDIPQTNRITLIDRLAMVSGPDWNMADSISRKLQQEDPLTLSAAQHQWLVSFLADDLAKTGPNPYLDAVRVVLAEA